MGKFGKWIAGGLGWAFFGPVGGLMGFLIGSMLDNTENAQKERPGRTTTGDFAVSLLVLVASVMKADGKVMKSELDYVKNYFKRTFGQETATEAIKMLKDLLNKNIPLHDVTLQMKSRLDYSSRLQLLHFLYGISAADNHFHPKELEVIELIAGYLGITSKDRLSIRSMFIEETNSSYKILEIEQNATEEEIKKAYRKMAMKYHPDKVSYLGDEIKKVAEEKFRKVNEAYEKIKKERGFN